MNAWQEYGQKVGVPQMVRLLQTVTHATTEHSIIFEANGATADDGGNASAGAAADSGNRDDSARVDIRLHVAVADMRVGGWHAPYLQWHTHSFWEFFRPSGAAVAR